MAFNLRQLITQARGFGAILFGFNPELDGAEAAHGVDHLGDRTILPLAGMFELVREVVLVQGVGLDSVNAAVKILDVRQRSAYAMTASLALELVDCHTPSQRFCRS